METCIVENSTDTRLDLQCLPINSLLEDDYFATVPLPTIQVVSPRPVENEEELYTLFEAAISERATRISRKLSSLPLTAVHDEAEDSGQSTALARLRRVWSAGKHMLTLTCLGLSLLLAGFDLMGLLVLNR
jgi:hypothetical protein